VFESDESEESLESSPEGKPKKEVEGDIVV
jgi:hypothetical protein